jgi:hypothetical protein
MQTVILTRGVSVIVDDNDYQKLSQHKWYACKKRNTFYAYRDSGPRKNKIRIPMHREILGLTKGDGLIVDHINQNPLDNRKENLRIVSHNFNQHNCKERKNGSGYRGVVKHGNGWMAQISVNGKHKYLGYFKDKIDAAKSFDAEISNYYGDAAVTNFPKGG